MKFILLTALLLPFAWGCKKKPGTDNSTSNPYTNSFTCLVNGEEWVAKTPNNPNGPVAVEVHYETQYDVLNVFATRKNQNANPTVYESVLIHVLNASSQNPNIYVGDGNTNGFSNYLSSACGIYYDSLYASNCIINDWHWYEEEHRFSGSFQIQLRNKDCIDSILTITNGQVSASF